MIAGINHTTKVRIRELRTTLLLCMIFSLLGFAFAWWINAEVVSDIEAKDAWSPFGELHPDQISYEVKSGTYYVCERCRGISDNANIMAIHNCISTITGKRELIHEQEVEIIE